jgi:glutamine synthetase
MINISVFIGAMITRLIEDIASGRESAAGAEQQLMKLGVAKLPEIEKDNTDRNRTSPFAFTGNKFEFRAVGSSQSIAFPVMLVNAVVAEAIGELTTELRAALETTPKVDDAILQVVRKAFQETASIRFEGNNYSDAWVKEAEQRGLPNRRRAPEALEQLIGDDARTLFTSLGILSPEELESRFHVKVERYVKDLLIELHTTQQIVDTMVLPAAYEYLGTLARGAAEAKMAGITAIPQIAAANEVGAVVECLRRDRDALAEVIERAEHMHEDPRVCAALLTSEGADRMAAVRAATDRLENMIADDVWPLPKYREMLFPV